MMCAFRRVLVVAVLAALAVLAQADHHPYMSNSTPPYARLLFNATLTMADRCPAGFTHFPPDDSCYIYFHPDVPLPPSVVLHRSLYNKEDPNVVPVFPTELTRGDAELFCNSLPARVEDYALMEDVDATARTGRSHFFPTPYSSPSVPKARLPVLRDDNHRRFLAHLVGRGNYAWLSHQVGADEAFRAQETHTAAQWVETVETMRPQEYQPWDPSLYDKGDGRGIVVEGHGECAAIRTRGVRGVRPGGNDMLVARDCGVKLPFICSLPRVPLMVTAVVNDHSLRSERGHMLQTVYGVEDHIHLLGPALYDGMYVSFQPIVEQSDGEGELGGVKGGIGICKQLHTEGPSRPIPVEVVHDRVEAAVRTPELLSSANSHLLCNGTCAVGTVSVPGDWPWVLGRKYAMCLFTAYPSPAPAQVATEYNTPLYVLRADGLLSQKRDVQWELATVTSVLRRDEQMKDVCHSRQLLMDAVFGGGLSPRREHERGLGSSGYGYGRGDKYYTRFDPLASDKFT